MKTSENLSSLNLRILRNGKILTSKNNNMIKKKSVLKMKNDNQLYFSETSRSDLNTLLVKNKNNSHGIMVSSNYDNLLDNKDLYLLFKQLSLPFINDNKVTFDDRINNNSNAYCYKNLEDYIQLNELQIYNEPKPKKERDSKPVTTTKTIQTAIPFNTLNKKNNIKTNTNLITKQNNDVRITRGKTIKLQNEERKQLNQIMFNKFPKTTFKIIVIELNDIYEEAKFLRTLGLTCRFKSPFTTYKLKK